MDRNGYMREVLGEDTTDWLPTGFGVVFTFCLAWSSFAMGYWKHHMVAAFSCPLTSTEYDR